MQVSEFDYYLPHRLIAQTPLERRDMSRLMVLNREHETIEHREFIDIMDYIDPLDVLVINDTRVIPARLMGQRESGGKVEILLLRSYGEDKWECLVRPGKRAKVGDVMTFAGGEMTGHVLDKTDSGGRVIQFQARTSVDEVVEAYGEMPVPHYIKAKLEDRERYQTVYATHKGSAAAPTAGLHFTEELLSKIALSGTGIARLTLHVGLGTFRPVKVSEVEDHVMHSEYYMLSDQARDLINARKSAGGKVIAVGTTVARTLETIGREDGYVDSGSGWTDIFIYPGYRFKTVQGMLTNFHLPKSTLIMMVSAFAGKDFILKAYETAVEREYRFFSFGDAMLIL